jgi:hypothetical protein
MMKLFAWRHMACPIVVGWHQIIERDRLGITRSRETWKTLYVFGLRLAMWRVEGAEES